MKTLADLQTPNVCQRKLLEKDVQKQCVDWARARGYWARKFSSMSQRSVPDYLFAKNTQIDRYIAVEQLPIMFAVEFKRPGATSTKSQLDEQRAMVDHGWTVFECDDFDGFVETVRKIESGAHA